MVGNLSTAVQVQHVAEQVAVVLGELYLGLSDRNQQSASRDKALLCIVEPFDVSDTFSERGPSHHTPMCARNEHCLNFKRRTV